MTSDPRTHVQNWRTQGQLVDSLVKQFESELAETKRQITAVNQERKLSQLTAGSQLRQAEQEYYMLTKKVREICLYQGNPNSHPGCNAGRPVLADHYGELPKARFG